MLVARDGRVVGVPVPDVPPDLLDVSPAGGTEDRAVIRTGITDARGEWHVAVPAAWRRVLILAHSGPRRASIETGADASVVDLVLPPHSDHRYRLLTPAGAPIPGGAPPLFLLASDNKTLVPAVWLRGAEFAGPPPGRWVPYVFPTSGYRLIEPVPGDRSEDAETVLRVEQLEMLEVLDKDTQRPVTELRLIAFRQGSLIFESASALRSEEGRYPLWPAESFSGEALERLVLADGYRSVWIGPDVQRMELARGEDPALRVRFDSPVRLEVTPLPLEQRHPGPLGEPTFRTLVHEGPDSEHALPAGAYLVQPLDETLPWTHVVLDPTAGATLVLERGARMRVDHAPGLELSATDRRGRRVAATTEREGLSAFAGLSDGAVLVEAADRPELAQVFEFTEGRRRFRFDDGTAPVSEPVVELTGGWSAEQDPATAAATAEDGIRWVTFRHRNGCRASSPCHIATAAQQLPAGFADLEFRVDGAGPHERPSVRLLAAGFDFRLPVRIEDDRVHAEIPVSTTGGLLEVRIGTRRAAYDLASFRNGQSVDLSEHLPPMRHESLVLAPGVGRSLLLLVVPAAGGGRVLGRAYGVGNCRIDLDVPAEDSGAWAFLFGRHDPILRKLPLRMLIEAGIARL